MTRSVKRPDAAIRCAEPRPSIRRDGDEREQGRQQDVTGDDEDEDGHGVLCTGARRDVRASNDGVLTPRA